jgi:TP53 regulating kinase and related kinases
MKHRFAKKYRHPTLDNSLTKARVAGEARLLLKCLRNGVRVPGVRMVDAECGILGLEWIEGRSIRSLLGSGEEAESELDSEHEEAGDDLASFGLSIGAPFL